MAGIFATEPLWKGSLSFAVTYFETPKANFDRLNINLYVEQPQAPVIPERAHAPEPSTLILFLSGIGGLIARFARKNFERFKRNSDIVLAMFGLLIYSPILAFASILI